MLGILDVLKKSIAITAAIAAWSYPAAAQTIVRADRMLDVEGGRIVETAVIVIENGLIQSVNPEQSLTEMSSISAM